MLQIGWVPLHFIFRDLHGRHAYLGLFCWPLTAGVGCEAIAAVDAPFARLVNQPVLYGEVWDGLRAGNLGGQPGSKLGDVWWSAQNGGQERIDWPCRGGARLQGSSFGGVVCQNVGAAVVLKRRIEICHVTSRSIRQRLQNIGQGLGYSRVMMH